MSENTEIIAEDTPVVNNNEIILNLLRDLRQDMGNFSQSLSDLTSWKKSRGGTDEL